MQEELKRRLKQVKDDYKERTILGGCGRGMRTSSGYTEENSQATLGDVDKASEFNLLYSRLDTASPVLPPTASGGTPPVASPSQPLAVQLHLPPHSGQVSSWRRRCGWNSMQLAWVV